VLAVSPEERSELELEEPHTELAERYVDSHLGIENGCTFFVQYYGKIREMTLKSLFVSPLFLSVFLSQFVCCYIDSHLGIEKGCIVVITLMRIQIRRITLMRIRIPIFI
jgi:hypothetical protein